MPRSFITDVICKMSPLSVYVYLGFLEPIFRTNVFCVDISSAQSELHWEIIFKAFCSELVFSEFLNTWKILRSSANKHLLTLLGI